MKAGSKTSQSVNGDKEDPVERKANNG